MKLPAFLAAHARATPEREALICGALRLSFVALDTRSDQLAAALHARGVGVGDRVAVLLPNCAEYVLAFLAIIKVGAIAVPIGTRLTPSEASFILADCAPRAMFIHPETRSLLERATHDVPVILVAGETQGQELDFDALWQAHAPQRFCLPVHQDDCMIAYTSGTTGRPKGAILTQSNYFVPNAYINALEWGINANDKHLITTPLTHRTAFGRVINMLCIGSPLVILPRFDANEAARLCATEGITVLGMVPTVGRLLLPAIEAQPQAFATVRLLVATGEAFPREVKARIMQALPQIGIHSYFAMTECGALTNLPPEEQLTRPTSIGRPIAGIEVRLMSAAGELVTEEDAIGELQVRSGEPGRFVTLRGYFNRPQETAEALRDGWFATGDLARRDAEGYLYIVDRKKDMVLSGGYNIYSKEVEAALLEHPAVQDAAVAGVPDAMYGEAVAAWVELRPGEHLAAEALIEHCRNRIAGYKKPKYVMFVDALPRNSSGKVLKYQLKAGFVAP